MVTILMPGLLAYCAIVHAKSSTDFFQNLLFFKNSSRKTISLSNSLDPGQTGCFVRPHLCPNSARVIYQQTTPVGKELISSSIETSLQTKNVAT